MTYEALRGLEPSQQWDRMSSYVLTCPVWSATVSLLWILSSTAIQIQEVCLPSDGSYPWNDITAHPEIHTADILFMFWPWGRMAG